MCFTPTIGQRFTVVRTRLRWRVELGTSRDAFRPAAELTPVRIIFARTARIITVSAIVSKLSNLEQTNGRARRGSREREPRINAVKGIVIVITKLPRE